MDSPENANPAPGFANADAASSPVVVQESPFFTYVRNLSPIKLVKDVHVSSAFRELNFPSPSPVFTSPRVNPIRKENPLRRCQFLSPDSRKNSLRCNAGINELSENTSHFGSDASQSMSVSVPCIVDSEREFPSQVQSSSSPSGSVDDFFADPMEECVNSCGPSDSCLDQAVELRQVSQGRHGNPDKVLKEHGQSQSCIEDLANQVVYNKIADSVDTLPSHYSSQVVETCSSSPLEIITTLDPHDSDIEEGGVKVAELSTSTCQIDGSPTAYVSSVQLICDHIKDSVNIADNGYRDDERPLNQCSELTSQPTMEDDPSEVPASDLHVYEHIMDQTANGTISAGPSSGKDNSLDHKGEKSINPLDPSHDTRTRTSENGSGFEQDSAPQFQLESLQTVNIDNNQQNNSRAVCNTVAENAISSEQGCLPSKQQLEGSQHSCAMRKRLEFVSFGTPEMDLECSGRTWNISTAVNGGIATLTESPASSSDLETLNVSLAESIETSQSMQVSYAANLSKGALRKASLCLHQTTDAHAGTDKSVHKTGSFSVTAPRPAGIGLHLNSIGNTVATNCNLNMQLVEKDFGNDCLSAKGEMTLHQSGDQRINDSKGCIASMTFTTNISAKSAVDAYSPLFCTSNEKSTDNQQQNRGMLPPNSSISLPSPLNVNPSESSQQTMFLSHTIVPCAMKRSSSENPCISDEQNEMSPKKKSKKASENDGCKRCNCKKSKCLKLYCDCFAAGVYCAVACACQACLNRPEYEDTVLETRQQIENRNPLAFAPKVIVHVAEAPKTSGDESKHVTPASARHKRGCNCKRSQCLKKYCECFQSKVGCSLGCRCEGCKNRYGVKNGPVEIVESEDRQTQYEKYGNKLYEATDAVGVRSEMSNNDKHPHLSPFTPLLEGSNGIIASKSQFPSRRYLSSPESAASALSPFSPSNSGNFERFQAIEGNSAMVPYDKELDVYDEVGIDTLSPGWDGFTDICNLSPLPNSSGDPRERTKLLFQGSSHISVRSLLWRTSPNTPTPRFGESKIASKSCSDSGPPNVYEDDTPDILKDTCITDKGPKISSPNKKRVSPPHIHLNEMISGSSTSMRSRKFILKSVPSFPSLTPYSNNIKGHGT
uniref:Protein lin-54 n=1 Tax=Anthurium amnicola TaxID=1678845 RepID=A0A1D1Y7H7_9ARAE